MNIFACGINYKTTPLEIREKISFTMEEQREALIGISQLPQVKECVLLSTCNRTEVYIYSESSGFNSESIEKFICDIKGLHLYDFKKYFYFYSSLNAVSHLFKVASGLDSMVLGEDQILGQVKGACEKAMEFGTSSSVLNTLFRNAVTSAKEVKTFTGLSKNTVSVASVAVKLLEDVFGGSLENRCALVIGAGKMGSLALKNLIYKGIGKIYITNRTHGKARELKKIDEGIQVIDYMERYSVMNECDVVISSTSSPHYTITRDRLENAVKDDKKRAFVDLAVPRDIDVSIEEMENVCYINMDSLKLTVDKNIDQRLFEVSKAEEIITKYEIEYEKWYGFREVLPVIKEIQKQTEEVLEGKIKQALGRLKCVSENDKEIVKSSITSTVNELLNLFVYSVRDKGSKDDIQAYFRCLGEVIKNEE